MLEAWPGDVLAFAVADLTSDTGLAEAMDGCDFTVHVASPVPHGFSDNEDDVIRPARDGALGRCRMIHP